MNRIKVLIVDDHPMVLEGMRSMLTQINFVDIVGTAANAYEAIELIKAAAPDIVITDINMPEISGIELTLKIKKEFPEIKVIAMSTFKERSYITQMIQNGASGYLIKSASKEEIEEAILSVHEGKLYMSLDISLSAFDKQEINNVPILSSREKEVLDLIADGFTNPQIAEKLFLSLHTVDSHRKNLLTKFGINNTASLIKLAAKYNML
ncbi:MAG: response regulator transcription factor [Chitinophagaceae bacterium]|jgi:DNA-binding NarL/FixJ family response regulator|nr:response regulator transcription factor [Chitinophagaceae bacterium]MBK7679222.1 response regulator transcription factor [Chitinophagaceae bacterium]MBK8299437.1 response regulator transcription factor [Chitinophagaceae bacterium]MBK9659394.1 response regulator transcription factor [Chitinophagaceae bacterium]MBK9937081.1 response regulator transcription factor [Chitinophagaceae bacterium]